MSEDPENEDVTEIISGAEDCGSRLDKLLSLKFPLFSRSHFQRLIKNGRVLCDGHGCTPKTEVRKGMIITIRWAQVEDSIPKSEDVELKILYEDDDLLVLDKPAGIVVHPAAGNRSGTIVNALLGKFADFAEKMDDTERPGIVHRLDKDTSGCIIIAKNPSSKFLLSKQFAERKIKKTYAAITYGHPARAILEIKTLIGRHAVNRRKMAVLERSGKEAITSFKTVRKGSVDGIPVAFLEVGIKTGRTHQIRVHLAHLKIPVLGDNIYGGHQKLFAPRHMLHAWKLEFPHPRTSDTIKVESPLPRDMAEILGKMSP